MRWLLPLIFLAGCAPRLLPSVPEVPPGDGFRVAGILGLALAIFVGVLVGRFVGRWTGVTLAASIGGAATVLILATAITYIVYALFATVGVVALVFAFHWWKRAIADGSVDAADFGPSRDQVAAAMVANMVVPHVR